MIDKSTCEKVGGEIPWIESEASYLHQKLRSDAKGCTTPGHEAPLTTSTIANGGTRHEETANDLEDEGEDEGNYFGNLFDDPDPMETFHFSYTANNDGSNDGCDTTIEVKLRGVKAENGQMLNSTGLTVWRASNLLCEFLAKNPNFVRGKRIVELGAGLGLCGIIASKLGAYHVVMTDGDTNVLTELRKNVEMNFRADDSECWLHETNTAAVERSSDHMKIACRQLIWGQNYARNFLEWYLNNVGNEPIDLVIGSDIIYVEDVIEPLFETVSALISGPPKVSVTSDDANPMFLLAFARRNVSIEKVFDCAKRHGYQWVVPCDAEGVFVFSKIENNPQNNKADD